MRTLKRGSASEFAGLVALWAAATFVACGGRAGSAVHTPPPVTLQLVMVTAPNASVAAGFTEQFSATGNYSDGTTKPLATVNWSSSDSTLATITSSGLLTTLKAGTITVTGASGSLRGSAQFRIDPASLQAITVSTTNPSVAAGLTEQFAASGTYSDGTVQSLGNANWSTSDPRLATITSGGLLTTLKLGTVTVFAASGSVVGSAPFIVDPPAATSLAISPAISSVLIGSAQPIKLSAVLSFTDQSIQDVSDQATWGSVNPFTASIDSVGNVSTIHIGYTQIIARNGSFSAAADFTVTASPRFLYIPTGAGRLISRTTVEANSGQLRMAGYMPTGANNYAAFPCPTIDPSSQFLYVASAINAPSTPNPTGEIQIYSLNARTGSLATVPGSPFQVSEPTGCIQFEPTGQFGYAIGGINGTGELLTYARNANTGILSQINLISLNSAASGLAVDPLGKYVFAATTALTNPTKDAQVYGYAIDSSSGALTPTEGTPFQLPNVTGGFSWHPSGNFLFMANTNGESIDSYAVDRATGKLTLGSSTATCINPTLLRFSPNGKFAYTACSMDRAHDPNSASVESFAVSASGNLMHLGSAPTADVPSDLNVDPSGRFIYESTFRPYVNSFQVGADGIARATLRQGIQANPGPGLALLAGGSSVLYTTNFAYITASGDNTFSVSGVRADGTLGTAQSFATLLSPFSLSLAPWGSNLLLASSGAAPNLDAYSLSGISGTPSTPPANFGNATTAGGVVVDPSELWAFETDSTNGAVSPFQRIGTNWAIGSTVTAAGNGAGPLVIDPSGRFLFVGNQGANSISAYQYFGTSPQLFESTGQFVLPFSDGSPFAIGAKPVALATDFSNPFLYVACNDQTLRVYTIDYESGGHIAEVANISLSAQPIGLAATPTGRFVYVADSGSVRAFSVDPQSGVLTSLTLNPVIQAVQIMGLYADPSGKFLYVTTNTSVFCYAINADGMLSPVSAAAVATSNNPSSMSFSATIQ